MFVKTHVHEYYKNVLKKNQSLLYRIITECSWNPVYSNNRSLEEWITRDKSNMVVDDKKIFGDSNDSFGKTKEELEDIEKLGINVILSDKIPLDREIPDNRHPA